ncbi:Transposase DDE domain protein [Leptospira santarosai]|uniref:Transposase DDE domain protein n=1 Tax=Leptospira santarosai TaxID=28183 RepID=A0A2P1QNQ2_9LEPT|nr:Transposase DDE domain protein [Leptospira santarosai]
MRFYLLLGLISLSSFELFFVPFLFVSCLFVFLFNLSLVPFFSERPHFFRDDYLKGFKGTLPFFSF